MKLVLIIMAIILTNTVFATELACNSFETRYFKVLHALEKDSECQEWQSDIIPKLDAYMDFWLDHGLKPIASTKLRIYLEPQEDISHKKIIARYFDSKFLNTVENFKDLLKKGSKEEILRMLDKYAQRYPLIFNWSINSQIYIEGKDPARFERLRVKLSNLMTSYTSQEGLIRHFKRYRNMMLPHRNLNALVISMGRKSVNDEGYPERPSYMQKDILFHEVAHALHMQILDEDISSMTHGATGIKETMADLFAHIYLGTTCHGIKMVDGIQTCNRNMTGFKMPLGHLLYLESWKAHIYLQPLRDLSWRFFKKNGIDASAQLFIKILHQTKIFFSQFQNKIEKSKFRQDSMYSEYEDYKQQLSIANKVFDLICETDQSFCDDRSHYFGEIVLDQLSLARENSPIILEKNPRIVELESTPYIVSFIFNASWRINIKNSENTLIYSKECDLASGSKTGDEIVWQWTMDCEKATWNGRGELVLDL